MHQEIDAAVNFLTRLVAKAVDPGGSKGGGDSSGGGSNHNNSNHHNNHQHSSNFHHKGGVSEEKIKEFSKRLTAILQAKFRGHWFPEEPKKGQAYRCIRINENCSVDGSIAQACADCAISYRSLRLPVELTLWIDPNEVTCRFGEHKGSYCTVVKLSDGRQENYVNSINIDELEQQCLEHQKNTFELIHSRKKRQQAMQAAAALAHQAAAHHRAKNSPMALFTAAANASMNGGGPGSPAAAAVHAQHAAAQQAAVQAAAAAAAAAAFHSHHHLTNGGSPAAGGHPGLNGHNSHVVGGGHHVPVTSAGGQLVNGYGSPLDVGGYGTPNGHHGGFYGANSTNPAGNPFQQHHVVGAPHGGGHFGSPTAHLFSPAAKFGSMQQQQQSQQQQSRSLNAALSGSGTSSFRISGNSGSSGANGSSSAGNKVLAGFLQQQQQKSSSAQQTAAQQQASFARGLQTAFNLAAVPFTPSTTSAGNGGGGSGSPSGGSASPAAGGAGSSSSGGDNSYLDKDRRAAAGGQHLTPATASATAMSVTNRF